MQKIFGLITTAKIVLLLLLLSPIEILGRKTTGNFVLSGVNSEYTVGSIALSKGALLGQATLALSSKDLYENERSLRVHLFMDTNWSKFQKATTCEEKTQLAKDSKQISFNFVRTNKQRQKNGGNDKDGLWKAHITMNMKDQKTNNRVHYWYMVVTDCSLEYQFKDGSLPKIDYELNMWNSINNSWGRGSRPSRTHLSADQDYSYAIHLVTMILSGFLALFMIFFIFNRLVDTTSVHFVLLLVMTAASLDSASSFCEIVHLKWYERNGYGWYFFDALSSHFEAMCDAVVAMVLLALSAGWTMPTDVIHVSIQQTPMQSLITAMRNPIEGLLQFNLAGILGITIVAMHLILAQWGRVYNDDFDSYHDFEHLPGRILMFLRITLGLIMIAACIQTKSNCREATLGKFYTSLSFIGTVWFQGLPIITWICGWAVPYHLRHPTVTFYGSACQSLALVLLTWLVVISPSSSSFHKLSRVKGEEKHGGISLADSLSASKKVATSWSLGKAKIRLD